MITKIEHGLHTAINCNVRCPRQTMEI